MNKVILIGRLTDDPAIFGEGEKKVVKYSLAIDRLKDGADFPSCVTFAGGADFAEKYLHKGMKIAVTGRLQTGSYTNREGNKVYTTDVIVDSHEFCEKREDPKPAPAFQDVPDDFEIPFR